MRRARRLRMLVAKAMLVTLAAVIDEVERGEDFNKGKFEAALRDDELPMDARQVVTRIAETIRADHDQISAMKHARH